MPSWRSLPPTATACGCESVTACSASTSSPSSTTLRSPPITTLPSAISVTPPLTGRSLAASAPAGAPISLPPSAPSSAPPHVGASMPTKPSATPYRVTPSSPRVEQVPRVFKRLRGRSGKQSGGQTGHNGDTLRPTDKPDRIERHAATTCRHCEACLTAAMVTGEERRQVFDLPQPHLEVTEHRAVTYRCHHCRGATTAAFPETVTAHVQYRPRLRATAVYLNVQQLIPENRVCEAMADLFAPASLCPASVVAWIGKAAEAQAPVLAHIAVSVVAAKVRHLDETGFRIGGKTRWLHSASTAVYTHYRVGEKRGDVPRTMADGVIVHDHFKAYYALRGAQHALCN